MCFFITTLLYVVIHRSINFKHQALHIIYTTQPYKNCRCNSTFIPSHQTNNIASNNTIHQFSCSFLKTHIFFSLFNIKKKKKTQMNLINIRIECQKKTLHIEVLDMNQMIYSKHDIIL